MAYTDDIQLISAPTILGLKPTGVELLAGKLLEMGLARALHATRPVVYVPDLNFRYTADRDQDTQCLNTGPLKEFSQLLADIVVETIHKQHFAAVLGGDCSVLIGAMAGLKSIGNYGLVFLDAHADFYAPEKSITGEVADMDLAIVTGRGPLALTDLNGYGPYVKDENVVHIGQRDWEETKAYGSADIKETKITCIDLNQIREKGIDAVVNQLVAFVSAMDVDGIWVHFDADVIDDELNPAVEYRLPGGLSFTEVEKILNKLFGTAKTVGLTVSVFNPLLDSQDVIAGRITRMLGRAFA